MNHFLNGVARAVAETFDLPGPILEIGSYQVAGQEEIGNLRDLFPGKPYVGLDCRVGQGVDVVGDVENLPWEDETVGAVIAMSTFEHVPRFWRGFEEIRRVLRPDGVLLVSCPFYFHQHAYPSDYWRFTPEALEVLLADYPTRVLGWHGPARRPANVWALAVREEGPAITAAQFAHYRSALTRYARQPLNWTKSCRYWLGSWFCGQRPFAAYLEQNRWDTVLHAQDRHSGPLAQLRP